MKKLNLTNEINEDRLADTSGLGYILDKLEYNNKCVFPIHSNTNGCGIASTMFSWNNTTAVKAKFHSNGTITVIQVSSCKLFIIQVINYIIMVLTF